MCPATTRARYGSGLVVLATLAISLVARCQARSNGTPDVRRMPEQENLYTGHAGQPWSSTGDDDFYTGAATHFNATYNRTRIAAVPQAKETFTRTRFKRGVVHLYNMVVCATGCNPLAYKGYGCYCGFLGSGYVIDGIDRCCKMHDWCYDATDCPMFLEYFVPYYWRCYRGHKPV